VFSFKGLLEVVSIAEWTLSTLVVDMEETLLCCFTDKSLAICAEVSN
jgi:hypothetical protein